MHSPIPRSLIGKKGHKQYCSNICSKTYHFNKLFKEELDKDHDPIRDELKNVHGFFLGTHLEHQIASSLFYSESLYFPWKNAHFEDEMEYPSLPIFYDNLCKVANGDWWFYQSPGKEVDEKVDKEAQTNLWIDLCRLLWYKHDSKRSEFIAIKIKEHHGLGEMSASRFVNILKANLSSLAFDESGRFIDAEKQGIRQRLRKDHPKKYIDSNAI